jgi:hypothetical protein
MFYFLVGYAAGIRESSERSPNRARQHHQNDRHPGQRSLAVPLERRPRRETAPATADQRSSTRGDLAASNAASGLHQDHRRADRGVSRSLAARYLIWLVTVAPVELAMSPPEAAALLPETVQLLIVRAPMVLTPAPISVRFLVPVISPEAPAQMRLVLLAGSTSTAACTVPNRQPLAQTSPQTSQLPFKQTDVDPEQTVPQEPQLVSSVSVSTHNPGAPQQTRPPEQGLATEQGWHRPLTQTVPLHAVQAAPAVPVPHWASDCAPTATHAVSAQHPAQLVQSQLQAPSTEQGAA